MHHKSTASSVAAAKYSTRLAAAFAAVAAPLFPAAIKKSPLIEMNRIRDSSHLLSISSKDLGTAIKNHVEDFENEIMAISSYDDYVDTLGNFASKVIFDIQNAQMSA